MDKKPTIEELMVENRELKAQLKVATQVKNLFVTNMSHEIRTPLNGVIAASDLALSENPSPNVKKYLKMIHTSGSALLELVNEILDFSKLDAGDLALDPVPFRIDDVLDSLTERFVDMAFKKRIELLVDIEPDIPKALIGDAMRLRQVLTNLLDNAIKFSNKGGVICVGVKKVDVSVSFVIYQFYIKDSGIGIPQEYLNHVFDPFSQVDPTASREYEGLGLSMHISKNIVELMGGQIEVISTPGKGSYFYFSARFDRQAPDKEEKYIFPKGLEGLHVLIVDDNADSRGVLKKMLHAFGFQTEEVASGVEALRRLKQISRGDFFDIIIMDWKMAELDGIETSKKIRKELKLSIPIILLTAFGCEPQKCEAEKLELEAFLTKPMDAPLLFNTIIDVLGKKALENERQQKHIATKASIYQKRLLGLRVLVAEDNPTNQDIALAVLEQAGIFVDIANNGQEAIEMVKKKPFDAVLMDIQMPRMDGLEATRIIRSDQNYATLPIIAMTAHALKGDEAQCLKAGMDGYITKPIKQDVLFYTLWKKVKFKKETNLQITRPDSNHFDLDTNILPEMLPGVDIRASLQSLNIDSKVFRRILINFYNNHQDYMDRVKAAFDKKDWPLLHSLAHSLKGSSANIGAKGLCEVAHRLETASKTEVPDHTGRILIEQLEHEFKQVMDSLLIVAGLNQEHITVNPISHLDKEHLTSLFAELKGAIAVADPDKTKRYFEAVKNQLGVSVVADLQKNLDVYDYDEALEVLEKIAQYLGMHY